MIHLKPDKKLIPVLTSHVSYITPLKKNIHIVNIRESQQKGNEVTETKLLQIFDDKGFFKQETIITKTDSTTSNFTYDSLGNCIEKMIWRVKKKRLVQEIFNYKYDSKGNILSERMTKDAEPPYLTTYKYNLSGKIIERRVGLMQEVFEYNEQEQKIRHERVCSVPAGEDGGYGKAERFLYKYNELGQLVETNHQNTDCSPPVTVEYQFVETISYLNSGLINSLCNSASCYCFSYSKKKSK